MKRWLMLLVIGAVVVSGIQGCVLVVADEHTAQEIRHERNRSRLARDIEKEIDADAVLDYSDIDVSENDGAITLKGGVDSVTALYRAVDIALSYPGVDELRLWLSVGPGD